MPAGVSVVVMIGRVVTFVRNLRARVVPCAPSTMAASAMTLSLFTGAREVWYFSQHESPLAVARSPCEP